MGKHSKKREKKVNYKADTVLAETEPLSEEHKKVIEFLQTVKFRKSFFGGLDERSVWKKIEELNQLYDEAIKAERIRNDVLLTEYKRSNMAEADSKNLSKGFAKKIISIGNSGLQQTLVNKDEE